jgi:phage tail sheath protein FI
MSDPVIGVVTRVSDEEARPALAADMSTVIMFGPMPDADPKVFALDTPVKGYSNSVAFTKAMGTLGFIPDAVRGLNDQLGEAQFAAQIIIVRTKEGTGADDAAKLRSTIANLVGDPLLGTGLYAGLKAPEDVGAVPRLWLTPGYNSQLANSIGEVTTGTRGLGYVANTRYPLTFTGGGTGALQATGYVEADNTGTLGDAVITSLGGYYTSAPTVTVAAPANGGTQGTFTATADKLANPVNSALSGILPQYLAHAAVESAGTSQANDEDFRESINDKRIIALVGGVKVLDPVTGATVVRPLAPRFVGALVRRDHETGGPFHSACNQPIRGIVGPARKIAFNIADGANEGQALLGINMGILVRGDVGNDFAIASGGYTILATDNAGEDEVWRFYNQQRGRDFIHIQMTRTLRFYLGKFNMTIGTINAVIGTMKNILRDLQANENILGWKVSFSGASNSAESIRQGQVTVNFAAEEPAPLRRITTVSSRYRPAIDAMVSQLEASLSLAA